MSKLNTILDELHVELGEELLQKLLEANKQNLKD